MIDKGFEKKRKDWCQNIWNELTFYRKKDIVMGEKRRRVKFNQFLG